VTGTKPYLGLVTGNSLKLPLSRSKSPLIAPSCASAVLKAVRTILLTFTRSSVPPTLRCRLPDRTHTLAITGPPHALRRAPTSRPYPLFRAARPRRTARYKRLHLASVRSPEPLTRRIREASRPPSARNITYLSLARSPCIVQMEPRTCPDGVEAAPGRVSRPF
jgi:hypothetical protein